MSMAVVLEVVRDYLRGVFPDKECDIQPDGQPPPQCPQRYIAVHPTSWGPYEGIIEPSFRATQEEYSFAVTVTRRNPNTPVDRRRNLFLDQIVGLDNLCRTVIVLIHQNNTFPERANTKLSALDTALDGIDQLPGDYIQQSFLTMPVWLGGDAAPVPRDGSWFWSDDPTSDAGSSMTINFGKVYRGIDMDHYVTFPPTIPSP